MTATTAPPPDPDRCECCGALLGRRWAAGHRPGCAHDAPARRALARLEALIEHVSHLDRMEP